MSGTLEINTKLAAVIFKDLAAMASQDPSRPSTAGMTVVGTAEDIAFVCTDGHRMARVIIPPAWCKIVREGFDSHETVMGLGCLVSAESVVKTAKAAKSATCNVNFDVVAPAYPYARCCHLLTKSDSNDSANVLTHGYNSRYVAELCDLAESVFKAVGIKEITVKMEFLGSKLRISAECGVRFDAVVMACRF